MNNEISSTEILKYHLGSQTKQIKDSPIMITFRLDNISNQDLWVLKWYTPLEGIKGKIFNVICDGKEILYQGPMIKRGNPSKNDYMHINQKVQFLQKLILSTAYELPEMQQVLCRVQR